MDALSDQSSVSAAQTMLASKLQVRLAVAEVELRHARAQREEAQSANRVLLRLLSSDSTKYRAFVDDEAWSSVSSQDSMLQEQLIQARRECELLRRRCSQLQRRRGATGSASARIRQVKAFLTTLSKQQKGLSSDSTPTTASCKTFVDEEALLTKDKDDFDVEVDNLNDRDQDDYDDDNKPTSAHLLDEIDTLAPWQSTLQPARSDKTAFVYRFKDTKHEAIVDEHALSDELKVAKALSITAESIGSSDTIADEGDLQSTSSSKHKKTSSSSQDISAAHSRQAPTTSATKARSLHQPLPLEPSQEYRMVSIRGLPDNVTASDILDNVSGGAIVCLSIVRPSFPGMVTTACITFFHHSSAVNFAAHHQQHKLIIRDTAVRVEHMKMIVSPSILVQMTREFCSRSIMIVNRPIQVAAEDLKEDLCSVDSHNEDDVEKIWSDREDVMHISFVSVEAAITAKTHLSKMSKYRNCTFQFVIDPCATRGLNVPSPQVRTAADSSTSDTPAQESFMHRKHDADSRHARAVYHQRAGYGLYDEPDVFAFGPQQGLAYDDDDIVQPTLHNRLNDEKMADDLPRPMQHPDSLEVRARVDVDVEETQASASGIASNDARNDAHRGHSALAKSQEQEETASRNAPDEQDVVVPRGEDVDASTYDINNSSANSTDKMVCNKALTTHIYCDCSPDTLVVAAREKTEVTSNIIDKTSSSSQNSTSPSRAASSMSSSSEDLPLRDSKGRLVSPGVLELARALAGIDEIPNDVSELSDEDSSKTSTKDNKRACSVSYSASLNQPRATSPLALSSASGLNQSMHASTPSRASSSLLNDFGTTEPSIALVPGRVAAPVGTIEVDSSQSLTPMQPSPPANAPTAPRAMLRAQRQAPAPMRIASPPRFGFSFSYASSSDNRKRKNDLKTEASFFYARGGGDGRKIVAYDDLYEDDVVGAGARQKDVQVDVDEEKEMGVSKKRRLDVNMDVKDEEQKLEEDEILDGVKVAAKVMQENNAAPSNGVSADDKHDTTAASTTSADTFSTANLSAPTPTHNLTTRTALSNPCVLPPNTFHFHSPSVRVSRPAGLTSGLASAIASDIDHAALEELGGEELDVEFESKVDVVLDY